MPAIIALLGRMLSWLVYTKAGNWIISALMTLGLTIGVQKMTMPALIAYIQSYASGLPPMAYQAFGAVGMDVFCSMVLSAFLVRFTGVARMRFAASAE